MLRTVLALVMGLTLGAEDLQVRVQLDQDRLNELLQDERWALRDALGFASKNQHPRAALEFRKFVTTHPDSSVWSFAAYSEAWHLARDRRYEAAKEVLDELIDLEPNGPESDEARLLLGRCHLWNGDAAQALSVLRGLIELPRRSTATLPGRVCAVQALSEIAQQRKQTEEDLRQAQLTLLLPVAEHLGEVPLNGHWLSEALDRLRALALRSEDLGVAEDLLRSLVAEPPALPGFNPTQHRDRLVQGLLDTAADRGNDGLVERFAAIRWTSASDRRVRMAQFWDSWLDRVARDGTAASAGRGLDAAGFTAWAEERRIANDAELMALIGDAAFAEYHRDLAWTIARRRLVADPPGTLALLDQALGTWSVNDARQAFEIAATQDAPIAVCLAPLERLKDGQRMEQEAVLLENLAKRRKDATAAERAVVICTQLSEERVKEAKSWLRRKAGLLEMPLQRWDEAIAVYEAIAESPGSDFDIARCLGGKGDWQSAFDRYSRIQAMHAGKDAGGQALFEMGRIAHERLNDKVRAVQILRKVCDEHPSTKIYSEAHVYLQHRLGVTYTGGG